MLTSPSHPQALEAYGILAGSLFSCVGLLLFATGRSREAYALGAAGVLLGGAAGFVRLMGRMPHVQQPAQIQGQWA